jgi:carbon storage regulator
MLVLSRKNGERVRIGDYVEVTVLEVHNGRVKLGFSGPQEIPIHREEVFRQLDAGTAPRGNRVGRSPAPAPMP